MATKYGSRPTGTDGSDFWHRESVAYRHKMSSINKARLKMDLMLQIVLCVLMTVRILPALVSFVGVGPVKQLRKWDLPAPRPWEYMWSISIIAAVLGLLSIPKNEGFLLKQYMIGTVVFGLLPIIYGIVDQIDDLYAYLNEKRWSAQFFGYPAVIVWFMFLTAAIQLHGFGLYFSMQLLKSWKINRTDKKLR
ncbi:protein jagunal homolog 1-like [Mytilus edulis]|uniref:protein jagunal homolog 1-like n=1 Tax=Mytilus edulis TaxID=6550 RepID=UPI0039F0D2DA